MSVDTMTLNVEDRNQDISIAKYWNSWTADAASNNL